MPLLQQLSCHPLTREDPHHDYAEGYHVLVVPFLNQNSTVEICDSD
jgi:hypothetical protein